VSNIQDDFTNQDDFFGEEEKVGAGDQALTVPFKGEVMNSVPTGFKITP